MIRPKTQDPTPIAHRLLPIAQDPKWRPLILIAVVITLLIIARALGIGERIGELREWIRSLGFFAPFVYILIYIIATVAAVPGSPISIAGGAIFGSFLGVIVVSIGSIIGAGLAFLIARYFARDAVLHLLSKNERFSKLDELTKERGAIIVAFTRLVPIFPFNLLNYGFGLTGVHFWTYLFWSWLCMLPGIILYVVGADVFTRGIVRERIPLTLIIVLVGIAMLLAILAYYARKRLQDRNEGGQR